MYLDVYYNRESHERIAFSLLCTFSLDKNN